MRKTRLAPRSFLLLGLAVAIGCDSDRPGAPTPVPAPQPGIETIQIAGPDVVEPGSSVQLRAVAALADGSTRDVTRAARWSVSPITRAACPASSTLTISISSDGHVAADQVGDAIATARVSDLVATREIVALPTGTFRLTGVVTIADRPKVPLAAVDIEVVQGVGRGLNARTGSDGCYALYGLSGSVTLRLTRHNYPVNEVVIADLRSHATRELHMWPAGDDPGTFDDPTPW
jgi:hypothetical protein